LPHRMIQWSLRLEVINARVGQHYMRPVPRETDRCRVANQHSAGEHLLGTCRGVGVKCNMDAVRRLGSCSSVAAAGVV
jgi:hypothetical protein